PRSLLRPQPGSVAPHHPGSEHRREDHGDARGKAAGERSRGSRPSARQRARASGGGGAAGAGRGYAAGERRGFGGHRSSAGCGGAAPEQRTGPPMKFDRRLLTHFEWVLPLLSLAVSALGVTTVYSATHAPGA